MKSNGSQFLLLHEADDFRTDARDGCLWDERLQVLRLRGAQHGRFASAPMPADPHGADAPAPLVLDPHGQLGFLSEDRTRLLYSTGFPIDPATARPVLADSLSDFAQTLENLELQEVQCPPGARFADLHLGGDGRAALSFSNGSDRHGLQVVHLARRWQARCALLQPASRIWVDHLDRVWTAGDNWLGLCSGEPLPQAYTSRKGQRFEPLNDNPHPLRLHWSQHLPVNARLLALCADRARIHLLLWRPDDSARGFEQLLLSRSLEDSAEAAFSRHPLPPELPFVRDIASLSASRLALMIASDPAHPELLDLPVIDLPEDDGPASLVAERFPQHSQLRPRFIGSQDGSVRYLSAAGPKQLHRLPQVRYLAGGEAILAPALDSGTPDTLWHKIYLEACVPPGCRLAISVKAYEDSEVPGSDWQAQPPPLWLSAESELAFQKNFFDIQPNRQGLYEILLQRADGEVREIRGRYLGIKVHMHGDGRHSPAIHAMRVYYPRLSWQQAYLPQHFHQQQRPDPAQQNRPANGADVRERLLACAEGMLTPIEEKIASAEYWAYPRACPTDQLPRLAAVLGAELPAHWPEPRQREWLANYGWLSLYRGTLAGLRVALDIATDGGVTRGQVVPVENYRLRRTMATILGLDMDDADHPLTLGTGQSGNSRVGESLILSEDDADEFLALFAPGLSRGKSDHDAVDAFFDNYAYQLSVVLHGPARAQRHTVEHVLQREAPAHLQWQLIETDHPFVLGLSPLLGIDTYLEQQPPWRAVVLDDTYLAREGIVRNPVALSPADADSRAAPHGDQP